MRRGFGPGLTLLLLALVALAYANAFQGGFQFDDFNVIVREASVRSPAAWWQAQPSIRPLLKLSHAINNASGLGLPGFHALNLAVHGACALLVGALLCRLGDARPDPLAGRRAAFAATLVFALHPVQTEAVTYVSGRSTSMAAMFALGSMVLWLQGRERGTPWRVHLASPLALAAALACKEYVLVTPLALGLLARWVPAGPGAAPAWRDLRVHAAVVALALAAACAVPRYRVLLDASLAARGIGLNLLTQAQGLFYLAGQMLRIDRLNADPALPVAAQADALHVLALLAWVALPWLALRAWRAAPLPAFAVLWFLLWLAPTQSVLPRLDVANDRQLYLALVGPAFAAADALSRCLVRPASWRVFCLVLMTGLAMATWQRNTVYRDEVGFWADVAHKSPHNARAFANLGYALAQACRTDQARAATEVALALDPSLTQAAVRLALMREGVAVAPVCPPALHAVR